MAQRGANGRWSVRRSSYEHPSVQMKGCGSGRDSNGVADGLAASKTRGPALKLMSWNVWGRTGTAADRQLAEVLRCEPDVLALQEVVKGSLEVWLEGLRPEGYSVIHSPIELLEAPGPYLIEKQKRPKRKNFNLTASRHPITALPGLEFPDAGEAFPEKHVATRVSVDNSVVDIHNTHLPPGSSTGACQVE